MTDEFFMNRALTIAERGVGYVSPNPKVGAVIVRENEIISEGWHQFYGGPHAEVNAISNANIDCFDDCTIYVTLEPCSHHGKTPPCADLIVQKKFKKVVIAAKDPNPLVSGKGIQKIKNTGIQVVEGVLEKEALWANRIFFKHIQYDKPYIMLKIAQTVDGCISLNNGDSKWITCEESRKITHILRHEFDAVLVGKNTVLKDNPLLTVRNVEGRNPRRVVCDTNLSLPLDVSLYKMDDKHNTIICCNEESAKSRKARNLILSGVNILPVGTDNTGKINLNQMTDLLYRNFGVYSIMVEGGTGIFSSFVKEQIVDEMQIFIAPKILGKCRTAFEDIFVSKVSNAVKFKLKSVNQTGDDIHSIFVSDS